MPPIPVHIEDPIVPTKASGITPKTDSEPPTTTAAAAPAITTPATPSNQRYRPAAPAQAPVPAPTGSAVRNIPPPTRTSQSTQDNGPPPPQPGAVPVAPFSNTTSIPPPPTNSVPVTSPPQQMQWSSPQENYAPNHSTDTTTPQRRGPTTMNLGPVTTSPGGYQQNVYAQDLSPNQRASLDQQERREQQNSGLLGNFGTPQTNETVDNVLNTMKGWGTAAQEKLVQAHGEAWKWIDGRK